jgi:hypothetical protein
MTLSTAPSTLHAAFNTAVEPIVSAQTIGFNFIRIMSISLVQII